MAKNAGRSTKWYSRPSISLARGLRVVCETENLSSGWLSVRMRVFSVVLPAPEGDERMSSTKSESGSLDILHLLAHFLDFRLELDHRVGDGEILRFRSDRIYLA